MKSCWSTYTENTAGKRERVRSRVYRLYPESGLPSNHELTIIFFHGLHMSKRSSAWLDTWQSRDSSTTIWPRDWLPGDLGLDRVLILSISYGLDLDPSRWGTGGYMNSVENICHKIFETLVHEPEWQSAKEHPIILVGHSFGGLVIKSFVNLLAEFNLGPMQREVEASVRFLDNMKGVVFYGVPHSSSESVQQINKVAANFRRRLPWRRATLNEAGIMREIEVTMEPLSLEFEKAVLKYHFPLCAILEGRPYGQVSKALSKVQRLPSERMVVSYASAMRLTGNNNTKVMDADHFEVCKPPTQEHVTYVKLVSFVNMVAPRKTLSVEQGTDQENNISSTQGHPTS